MSYDIKKDFRAWQKEHPNFITPNIKQIKIVNNFILELSEGTDFEHKPMFGVSAAKQIDGSTFKMVRQIGNFEPSKPFHDFSEAKKHMGLVENKLKECLKKDKSICEVKI